MQPESAENKQKIYSSPQLRDYGTIAELTESQSATMGKVDGKVGYGGGGGGGGGGGTYANLKTSPN